MRSGSWVSGSASPAGIAVCDEERKPAGGFSPGPSYFSPKDNVGSPYCVRRYVSGSLILEDPTGWPAARQALASPGACG